MKEPSVSEAFERLHGVPLDETEPCLDCGKPTSSGLYLAGKLRPLCLSHHLQLLESENGGRLNAALQKLNALGHGARRAEMAPLDAAAARELEFWLLIRGAERRNTTLVAQ